LLDNLVSTILQTTEYSEVNFSILANKAFHLAI